MSPRPYIRTLVWSALIVIGCAAPGSWLGLAQAQPGNPGAPTLVSFTGTSVTLSWAASSPLPTVYGYYVFRATTSTGAFITAAVATSDIASGIGSVNGGVTYVGSTASTVVTFTDATVVAGTTYYYSVVASDNPTQSPKTTSAAGSTVAITPIAAPTLTATAASGSVTLSWAPVAGATSYNIYRGAASGSETLYFTGVTATTTTYTDSGVTNGTTYYYTLAAVNASGTSAKSNEVMATPTSAPAVINVAPNSGPTSGGTIVTITGTAFSSATAVTFGSIGAATFNIQSATVITATSPAQAAGVVNITVTTAGGTSSTGAPDQFTYVAAPVVSNVAPNTGPVTGGTAVNITGTNFTGATAVNFGGIPAASFTVVSATNITVSTPPAATVAGIFNVTVTTPGGTSATASVNQFSYAAVISGIIQGGTLPINSTGFTIFGAGFAPSATGNVVTIAAVGTASGAAAGSAVPTAATITMIQCVYTAQPTATGVMSVYVTVLASGSVTSGTTTVTTVVNPVAPTVVENSACFAFSNALPSGSNATQTFSVIGTGFMLTNTLNTVQWSTTPTTMLSQLSLPLTPTSATASKLTFSLTYPADNPPTGSLYAVVTVMPGTNQASSPSTEVQSIAQAAGPGSPSVQPGINQNLVTWSPSNTIAAGFNIYRTTANTAPTINTSTGAVVPGTGTLAASYTNTQQSSSTNYLCYNDYTAATGTTYYYWIANYDPTSSIPFSAPGLAGSGMPVSGALTLTTASGGVQLTWTAPTAASAVPAGNAYSINYYVFRTPYDNLGDTAVLPTGTTPLTTSLVSTSGGAASANYSTTIGTYGYLTQTTSAGSFVDTSVVPGTSYTYEIATVITYSTGTSQSTVPWTSAASGANQFNANSGPPGGAASIVTVPPPPVVAASGGTGQVVLTWAAVSGATSYNIYRSLSMGGEGTNVYASTTATTYTDVGSGMGGSPPLMSGTAYFYTVTAVNGSGASASSTEASATTLPGAPALVAIGGAGQVALSWPPATGATSYNIYRSLTSQGEGTTVYASTTATSYTDTGTGTGGTGSLASGTTYYYKMAAVATGVGAQSTEASAITIPAPPSVTATGGAGQVALSWPPVTGASSYNIYRSLSPGNEGTTIYATTTAASFTDTGTGGLNGGTLYYYTAASVNISGASAPSTEVFGLTLPAAPTVAAAGGNGQIVLSWPAVAGATSYNIYRGSTSQGEGNTAYASVTATTYTDTGAAAGSSPLPSGTVFFYKVAAINATGTGPQSTEASAVTVPAAPTLAAAAEAGQVALSWSAVTGASQYSIYRSTTPSGEGNMAYATATATTYTDTGAGTGGTGSLSGGVTYYYKVAAANVSGTGPQSNEASATLSSGLPTAVTLGQPTGAGVTQTGTLTAASYQGNAASNSGSISTDGWIPQGTYQDWYQVTLQAGSTYVISMWTSGNSFLSIQDSTNQQVAWNGDAEISWLGSTLASQVVFTPATTGPYTIICSTELPATTLSYTLAIPPPSPSPATISVPYGPTASALSSTSYYGAAAATNLGSPNGSNNTWAAHQQDWYSFSLAANETFTITMTMTSGTGTAVLSLQNSNGEQLQYVTGSPSAVLSYTPGATGTYSLICSQLQSTQATTPYSLTIPAPNTAVYTTLTILAPAVLPPANGLVTVQVTSQGSSATPQGTVTLAVAGNPGITQTLSAGQTTFTVAGANAGTSLTLTANYFPVAPFQPSGATGTLLFSVPNVALPIPNSDTRIVWSKLPGSPRRPDWHAAALHTPPASPHNVNISWPLARSQTLTDWSALPENSRLPCRARLSTRRVNVSCPVVRSQTLMI